MAKSTGIALAVYSEYALADIDPDNALNEWTIGKFSRLKPMTIYGHPIFKRISGIPDTFSPSLSGDTKCSGDPILSGARQYTFEFSQRNIPVMIDPEGQYAARLRKTPVYFFTKELGLAHILAQIDVREMSDMGYLIDVDTQTWVLTHNSYRQPFSLGVGFHEGPSSQGNAIDHYSLKSTREPLVARPDDLMFDRQEEDQILPLKYTGSDLQTHSPLLKFRMTYRKRVCLHTLKFGCGLAVVKDFQNENAVNTVAGEFGKGTLKDPLHVLYLIPGHDEIVQLNTEDLEDVLRGKRVGERVAKCGYNRTRHFGLTFILQSVNRHGERISNGEEFLRFNVRELGDDEADLYDVHVTSAVLSEESASRQEECFDSVIGQTNGPGDSIADQVIQPIGEGARRAKELFYALTNYPKIESSGGLILTPNIARPYRYEPAQMVSDSITGQVGSFNTEEIELDGFNRIWVAHINELLYVLCDYCKNQSDMWKLTDDLLHTHGGKEAMFRIKMADGALTMSHLQSARMITAQLVEKAVEFIKQQQGHTVYIEYKTLKDYQPSGGNVTWQQVLECNSPQLRQHLQSCYDNDRLIWDYVSKINNSRALEVQVEGMLPVQQESEADDVSKGTKLAEAAAHNYLTYKDFKQLMGFPWGLVRNEVSLSMLKNTASLEREALCNIIHQIRLKQLSVYSSGLATLLAGQKVNCWSATLPSTQYLTNVGPIFNMTHENSRPVPNAFGSAEGINVQPQGYSVDNLKSNEKRGSDDSYQQSPEDWQGKGRRIHPAFQKEDYAGYEELQEGARRGWN